MAFGLGGVSETIVSGRTAGLEALILGARRTASGDADRILVVAAEGIDDAMREAWAEERSALGPRAAGVELVETGASVFLEAREEEFASKERLAERYVSGTIFFEPDARRAAARFFEWVKDVEGRCSSDPVSQADITLCTPGYEDFLEGKGKNPPRIERFGAAGLYEIAREVAARRTDAADALSPHLPSKEIHLYVTRDVSGAVAAVALEFFSSSQSLFFLG